jgi:ABC-type transport system involved in multi-copper enzyme maturation permease subunit
VERGLRVGVLGEILLVLLGFAVVTPGLILACVVILQAMSTGDVEYLAESFNRYVRIVGTLLVGVTLLAIAIRAASSISSEKERQTYESLLASPLSLFQIFWAKWLGSLLGPRKLLLFLVGLWIVGTLTTAIHWLALPCLLLALVTFACFATTWGMFCAVLFRSGMRAITFAVLGLILLCFGPLMASWAWNDQNTWTFGVTTAVSPLSVVARGSFTPGEFEESWSIARFNPMDKLQQLPNRASPYGRGKSFFDWHPHVLGYFISVPTYFLLTLLLFMTSYQHLRTYSGRITLNAPLPAPPEPKAASPARAATMAAGQA